MPRFNDPHQISRSAISRIGSREMGADPHAETVSPRRTLRSTGPNTPVCHNGIYRKGPGLMKKPIIKHPIPSLPKLSNNAPNKHPHPQPRRVQRLHPDPKPRRRGDLRSRRASLHGGGALLGRKSKRQSSMFKQYLMRHQVPLSPWSLSGYMSGTIC